VALKGDYHVRKNCCLSKSLQRKLLARESYREAVSSRLGHAEVGTTLNIYTKALRSADRACADTMSGILKKAEENGAWLVAKLIREIPSLKPFPGCVKQHYDWSGKNCPAQIRARANGWNNFLGSVF